MDFEQRLHALAQAIEASQQQAEVRAKRLDERQEALSHTVELLASFLTDMAERMDARDAAAAERDKAAEARIARLEQVWAAIGKVILDHENRLNRVEGQPGQAN
jgi:chromosome segregation ATPase